MATNKSEVMSGAFTGERFDVVNPRTGRADYVFTAPADRELTARLAALRAAQPAWRDAGLEARIAVMARWRAALVEHRDAIVRALATDTGRYWIPVSEFNAVLGYIDRWSHDAVLLTRESQGESRSMPALRWRSQHIPYSLVGVISPWNFPFTLAVIDAIPALLAGCAVCVKPSEITPRFAAPLAASIAAVPELARVLAVIPGGRGMGEALVAQSDVVCFTGSVKTGRLVGENAARHFVPAFLELGGKDPLIVTASADLGRATDVALRASVLATGQACQSLERVYVDRRIYQPFVDQLVAKARKVELNWPDLHAGHIGPFIWGRQGDIGQFVKSVSVLTAKGEHFTRTEDELSFSYRRSSINELCILSAEFQLTEENPSEIDRRMRTMWIMKKAAQPFSFQSAGCIFKNPRGLSAGALIEQAGLKATRIGACEVSDRHANFIVTHEGATSADVLRLIDLIRSQIHDTHGIELELEIDVW